MFVEVTKSDFTPIPTYLTSTCTGQSIHADTELYFVCRLEAPIVRLIELIGAVAQKIEID